MTFFREGIQIGSLTLRYYGVLLLTGALIGTWLNGFCGKKHGIAPETQWDVLPWALIFGIIGARLWHVLMPSISSGITTQYYFQHPLQIFAIWNGGLGVPGSIIGGIVGVALFGKKYGFRFFQMADSMVPGMALAQAIGRWGNFVNQELYGSPTNLPWAVHIDAAHRLAGFENQETYHPLFLYESIFNLCNMAFLIWLDRNHGDKLKEGDLFYIYIFVYSTGRFFLEFLRLDKAEIGTIDINQMLMAVFAVLAALVLVLRHVIKSAKKDLSLQK